MSTTKDFYDDLPSQAKIILLIVAIIILLYSLREAKRWWEQPKEKKVNFANVPAVGGINNSNTDQVTWDPDPLAAEIAANLQGYNFWTIYPETSEKVLDLQTDDQLILLYNHYNNKYAEDGETMTALFAGEYDQSRGKYDMVVKQLRKLGLH
ncbi:MAG: hypothetical protein MK066_14665 [Crocinitomicaceae bacterium]|nr:hypothetical protein [Crocinitomicaceae bacterium]